jgi:hypothetical protein
MMRVYFAISIPPCCVYKQEEKLWSGFPWLKTISTGPSPQEVVSHSESAFYELADIVHNYSSVSKYLSHFSLFLY